MFFEVRFRFGFSSFTIAFQLRATRFLEQIEDSKRICAKTVTKLKKKKKKNRAIRNISFAQTFF